VTAGEPLVHRVRPAAEEPAGALVLLHGRGADELDLQPLIQALDPARRLVGLTPRGPLSLPPGGAHWYVVRRVGYPDPATFRSSYEILSTWLDALPGITGVPLSRTVIGGFSQGAVMSYALALGPGRPAPAGLLALSGFMPNVEGFALDLEDRAGFPVAVGHGSHDPVIPVDLGRAAHERLADAGVPVLWRESPIDHSIDPRFVAELRPWLSAAIGATGARSS
jgi:phospholipase/carboxylesterase